MKARLTTLLLALLAGGFIAAGCGGSEETKDAGDPGPAETPQSQSERDAPASGQQIENPADASGKLAFEKKKLTGKAGQITLVMENPSSVPHAIAIRGNNEDASGETVEKGGTSKVEVAAKPGEYEFYCPVPGHEPAGMKGTLTVE